MNEKHMKPNMLKCATHTFFFDIKESKNGNKYLRITESRFDKTTKQSKRNSFVLFKEDLKGFIEKVKEIEL